MALIPAASALLLTGLSLLSECIFAADSPHPAPATRDSLQANADQEFEASGQALRERLRRLEEGDALGAAIAEQTLKGHRARFLDLKRALARLSAESSSAAAQRNPFEPHFQAPPPPAAKADPVAPGRRWDLYARSGQDEPTSSAPVPTGLHPGAHWGMYALPATSSEAPARPFLVYRADFHGVLQSTDIHTKE
jgi:hypothetical protein